jgi:hypothetical protein
MSEKFFARVGPFNKEIKVSKGKFPGRHNIVAVDEEMMNGLLILMA